MGSTRFSWGHAALGIALALMAAAPARSVAQTITMLTWNHPNYEARYREAIAEFEAEHEGVTVEWLDKKGTEYATFFQTQLVAGTPPDVVQLQGMLWLEYADAGVIADLSPRMADVEGRFEPGILDYWEYQGKQWVVPSQYGKTLLHYNWPMLAEAGIEGPPRLDGLPGLFADGTHESVPPHEPPTATWPGRDGGCDAAAGATPLRPRSRRDPT